VFRNPEKALAIYGATNAGVDVGSPIEIVDALGAALEAQVNEVVSFCAAAGVDLPALRDATGFAQIALRDGAVESLLMDSETRDGFMARAPQVRKLFKALLPDPKAAAQHRTVAAIRVVAQRLADAVVALLDR
jgi:type I restriction enzyme R subunit